MPSKRDRAEERRVDSWLFRLANKRDSSARVRWVICLIVAATVALTLLAVKIFR